MNTDLLITIIIVSICLGAYIIFLVRQYRAAKSQTIVTVIPGGRMNQVVISDAATYHETKASMGELRRYLDRFDEAVDLISKHTAAGTKEEIDEAYREGIPKMHRALVNARNTAQDVSNKVMRSPSTEEMKVEIIGDNHRAPSGLPIEDMENGPFATLLMTIEEINPCIAGFYYSFTDPDESTQTGEAVIHINSIVRYLENAIYHMTEIEKVLATLEKTIER